MGLDKKKKCVDWINQVEQMIKEVGHYEHNGPLGSISGEFLNQVSVMDPV